MAKNNAKNKYDPSIIEPKWQKIWSGAKLYGAGNKKGDERYILVELAYSSGDLHIGHWYAWSGPDAYARYLRMCGYNVLFPVGGFDSFGLPAENAAIKRGIHPSDWTSKNIETMRKQFATMGPSFDWEKEVITSNPNYYKWTQWLFLKFYKAGLAYRAKAPSNWCPDCKTVLANEHVVNGHCWRHSETQVEQKDVEQWFLRITDYADKLIWPEALNVDWPEETIKGQNKWIGKKDGIMIRYEVEGSRREIECWTSRPDTNFGATFIVLAPDHPLAQEIAAKNLQQKVKGYIKKSQRQTNRERLIKAGEKTGVFTGAYAINKLNGEKLPIWVSDFVLSGVGTGAVVGVPGHDRRDFEFAKKFKLPVLRVVEGLDGDVSPITKIEQVQEETGKMVNSGFLDGLDIHTAIQKMMDYLQEKGWGKRQTVSHLRDWSVSRQRYWGAPVPIIYCTKCGTVPVSEEDLPVTLPYEVDYTPTGRPPLATALEWLAVKCPECGGEARREPETLDTYVDSAWYFLRYPDPKNDKEPFDKKIISDWLPIDVYFGGREHILGHTLYARFVTKFLQDQGYLTFGEFAQKRVQHGDLLGPDGRRMSKSRGNVVNPDDQVKKYGADTVRTYLCFFGPYDQGAPWSQSGIEGTYRFLTRVWHLVTQYKDLVLVDEKDAKEALKAQHLAIQKVTKDISSLHFNTAIAGIMEYVNTLKDVQERQIVKKGIKCAGWKEAVETLLLLLAPFAPFMTEELWQKIKVSQVSQVRKVSKAKNSSDTSDTFGTSDTFESIHFQPWPKYLPELVQEEEVVIPVQVNGRLRGTITLDNDEALKQEIVEQKARELELLAKYLETGIKKVVFVPGKLVNFVV